MCRSNTLSGQPKLLGKADPLQLAGRPFRDLGDEDNLARCLEIGKAGGGKIPEITLGGREALAQCNSRSHLLAKLGMR